MLDGTRVLDVTSTLLGPYATLILAQLGADVVKLEPPGGDISRRTGHARNPGMSAMYLNMNRGKRSIVLDLKQPAAREAFRAMVPTLDVLVHNLRPQVATRLGLDADSMLVENPRLVHCGAYGFGEDGPYAGRPAYDDIIQAASGLVSLQQMLNGEAGYVATVIADKTCALHVVYAVLAGLLQRERTGRGVRIDVPMYETMAAFTLAEQMGGMAWEPPVGPPTYPRTVSRSRRPFRTADGSISVMPYTDSHWHAFLTMIGRPELLADPRFADQAARSAHIDDVYAEVAGALADAPSATWLERCAAADVPAVNVNRVSDLFDDPHLRAVRLFDLEPHPTEGLVRHTRSPVRFSSFAPSTLRPAPSLGGHTRAVLREAGLDDDVIDGMVATGAASEGAVRP